MESQHESIIYYLKVRFKNILKLLINVSKIEKPADRYVFKKIITCSQRSNNIVKKVFNRINKIFYKTLMRFIKINNFEFNFMKIR